MRPVLYPTPFSRHWRPVMARLYGGLLPDRMDHLTHSQLGLLLDDLAALTETG